MPQLTWSLGAIANVATQEGQDPYYATDDEGGQTNTTYLPPVYMYQSYSVQAIFSVIPADETESETYTVTSVSVTNSEQPLEVYQYSLGTNSITIVTGSDSPFNGEYFEFMKWPLDAEGNIDYANPDYTIDWTPTEAIENEYDSIVQYNPPDTNMEPTTHTITVNAVGSLGGSFTDTITLNQNIYFDWPPITQFVTNLVSQGSI